MDENDESLEWDTETEVTSFAEAVFGVAPEDYNWRDTEHLLPDDKEYC